MTSRPPTRSAADGAAATSTRPPSTARTAAVPGPKPGSAWLRRFTWVAIGAMVVVLGAIGLSFALAFVASWIGGDAEGAAYVVGMLIGMPAFLLLVPVLLVVAGLDYASSRTYRGKSIAASWDVRLDGEDHVVSLPASRISAPDHVWVDGARIPLAWTPTGTWSARAALDGGTFSGTLSQRFDKREASAILGLAALTLVLGRVQGVAGLGPAIPSRSRVRPSRPSRSVTGNAGPRRGNWPAVPAGGLAVAWAGSWCGSSSHSQRPGTRRRSPSAAWPQGNRPVARGRVG